MTRLPIIFLILLPILSVPAQADAKATQNLTYTLKVEGMSCALCENRVKKQLKKIEGVSAVTIDLDKGLVTVVMHAGGALSQKQVGALIRNAGFNLRDIKRSDGQKVK